MTERRIELPRGGVAWYSTEPTHAQAKELRRHNLRLARFVTESGFRTDLTPEEMDAKDDLLLGSGSLYIRTLTVRWEGVTSPEGDALTLPDDIERMAEVDAEALYDAIATDRRAEGNAQPPSEPSPPQGRTRRTPTSAPS